MKNKKERIVTGITATGKLTLGNYIGAIKNLIEYQNSNNYDIYMFVADLHALSLPIDPDELRKNIKEQLSLYIACGIDYKKTKLFKQSEIIGHSDIFYYLTVISNEGQLKRMTQYKDKAQKNANKTEQIPLGLLMYPILMAGDILIYNADGVIVGQDQKQHLELTRDLAERLLKKYKVDIKIPNPIIAKEGAKIMALKTPTKKMSKSDKDIGETIFLLDDEETIRKKIKTSLTDSENKVYYDIEKKPGVSNLITIYSSIKNISIKEASESLKDENYKNFKEIVANEIIKLLKPIQDKYFSLKEKDIDEAINYNKKEIQSTANKMIEKIKKGFGLN